MKRGAPGPRTGENTENTAVEASTFGPSFATPSTKTSWSETRTPIEATREAHS
jgi:hypothetical protein